MNLVNDIFEKQKVLIEKLFIDGKLPYDKPQDIDHPAFQAFLKSLAWCTVEEFTEAASTGTNEEYFKELSDALHFITELCIFSQVTPVISKTVTIPNFWDMAIELGLAMNELKNRPWTKTLRITNKSIYKEHLSQAWSLLAAKMLYIMGSEQAVFDHYMACNSKNHKRVADGY